MSWFADLANQAMKMVDDLADSVVSQATEAQQQIIQEQQKLQLEENQKQRILQAYHSLPWETDIESRQILCKDLMEKILGISLNEKNFLVRASNADEVEFYFQEFVPVAMQLLQLDANLARLHGKLSPKMNEEDLWFNYYCRVVYLRARSGIDGPEALSNSSKWNESDILMGYDVPTPVVLTRPIESMPSAAVGSGATRASPAGSNKWAQRTSPAPSNGSPVTPKTAPAKAEDGDSDKEEDDDDIDLDDLDDDLGDEELLEELGDMSPEDFENIGSSEANDELEAQIAQELAEEGLDD